jgi:hypothetical protein
MPIQTAIIKNNGTNRKTMTGQKLLIIFIPIGLRAALTVKYSP